MIKVTLDKGHSSNKSYVYVILGKGKGYMNKFWVDLNKGPGLAVTKNTSCGHTGLNHCNSAYCNRKFCKLPQNSIVGFFLKGHTLTIFTGAAFYKGTPLKQWFKNSLPLFKSNKIVTFDKR